MTEETGLEYRCHIHEKVYGFVASEQIRNGMRPVHISQRWACLWLKISGRSWRRSTQHLSSLGYVGRHIIRGRGRGSIYWIDWKSANSLAELYSKPNGNMAKNIGHKARKNGHLDPLMNTRNRPLIRELRPLLQYEKSAKMNPIPPKGGNQAPPPGRTPPEEGRTAPKTSLEGRQLINVSLSPDIFEAAQADEELLQMCLTRGMIRLTSSVSQADSKAGSAFDTAKAIVTQTLKTKGERYLEAVAAKEAETNAG